MKSFAVSFGIVFILITLIVAFTSGKGIVALEDYSEAVAFCGNEIEWVTYQPDEASVRYDKEHNITYVINSGHEDDYSVIELEELAEVECRKLGEQ